MGLDEILGPDQLGEHVAGANSFRLGGALGVELVLTGGGVGASLAHGHHRPGMALHVAMDSEGCVHVPFHHVELASLKGQRDVLGLLEVTEKPTELLTKVQ